MIMEELNLDDVPWTNLIHEAENYYVFYDGFPVGDGHQLFVPKYNTQSIIEECLAEAYNRGSLMQEFSDIPAFNIGMNCGAEAGQTVMWPHIHLIPRIKGDMDDPRGGVRHVIPEKGNYKTGIWDYNEKDNLHVYTSKSGT